MQESDQTEPSSHLYRHATWSPQCNFSKLIFHEYNKRAFRAGWCFVEKFKTLMLDHLRSGFIHFDSRINLLLDHFLFRHSYPLHHHPAGTHWPPLSSESYRTQHKSKVLFLSRVPAYRPVSEVFLQLVKSHQTLTQQACRTGDGWDWSKRERGSTMSENQERVIRIHQ